MLHAPATPSEPPIEDTAAAERTRFVAALRSADRRAVLAIADAAFRAHGLAYVYERIVVPAMEEIGEAWASQRITVAEEHVASVLAQAAIVALYPRVPWSPSGPLAIVACVADERHELGARMVADLLALDGWNSMYVGADVPASDLAELARTTGPRVLALSITLSSHLPLARDAIAALRHAAPGARIVVGGRGVPAGESAATLGVDAVAGTARAGVEACRAFRDARSDAVRTTTPPTPSPRPSCEPTSAWPSTSAYSERQSREMFDAGAQMANLTRELARKTAELEANGEHLRRLAALRDDFIATLSHDLRSPVQAIRMQSERLAGDAGARIRRNTDRILMLVDKVLEAARVEAGTLVLDRARVDVETVAREVLEMLGPQASQRSVALELVREGASIVDADRVRVFQILANLTENAIRHSPNGGRVTVRIEDGTAFVRCSVTDQGPGVPRELRPTIFDRFRQAGGRAGSVGLGLYIARELVERHGGRIGVEDASPSKGGARFWFELPRNLSA